MSGDPFTVFRAESKGRFVIVCDHASNYIPEGLNNLGLGKADLQRHIAWDIGAGGIAARLSEHFDSPAVFCGTSRLVIDVNRQLDTEDLIPVMSDKTSVPGNQALTQDQRTQRIAEFFHPYHDAIESVIVRRLLVGEPFVFLSVHTMTHCLRGQERPWPIALSSYRDRKLSDPLLAILRRDGTLVGDNEPYNLDPAVDFSTPFHAIRRKLPHIQVEFRQDLVSSTEGQARWADFFASALERLTSHDDDYRPIGRAGAS
jgi:predicted N-formylglutamate amidohydrolase